MRTTPRSRRLRSFAVLLGVMALIAASCDSSDDSGGISGTEVVNTGTQAPATTAAAAAPEPAEVPNVIVQAVDVRDFEALKDEALTSGAPTASVDPSWDTDFSRKFGISLLASFDSDGDAAWDPAAHPLVYVASEGPGYSGLLSGNVTMPGFMMIDANTRETVAAVHYDIQQEEVFEPHGLGVSPGGEWIYVPTGTAAAWGSPLGGGRLLIINAKTFKLDKVLSTLGNPHHIKSFVDASGRPLTLVENFSDSTFYVLDPNDDNKVVGGIGPDGLKGNGYLGFAHPSGKYLMISVRTPFRSEGGVAVVDTESWRSVASIETHDSSPIYVAYSADGNTAYVSGGHESTVVKIDISEENPRAWDIVGSTSAGTLGPYGLTLNWDETQLWAIGKGEGAHNRGNTMGLIDPNIMTMPPRAWAPGSKGSFYTDCVRGDHAIVHPDPAMNEMWISCNASFETVIWDFETLSIKESVPTPNGGSTHNGAFVQYTPDFVGEVLADQNGLQGSALELKLQLMAAG